MNEKEMNLAILNKLYEIADKVFNDGVNVKEGNYTASDLAKMKDSAFKDGYLETENKKVYDYSAQKIVEKDCNTTISIKVNQMIVTEDTDYTDLDDDMYDIFAGEETDRAFEI